MVSQNTLKTRDLNLTIHLVNTKLQKVFMSAQSNPRLILSLKEV